MKMFVIECGETDWIVAHSAEQAWHIYCNAYGLDESDDFGVEIVEILKPENITFQCDEVDLETEDQAEQTGADILADATCAEIVASTSQW